MARFDDLPREELLAIIDDLDSEIDALMCEVRELKDQIESVGEDDR